MRHGWDFCAKTQFLGVFRHFCDPVSFRRLPWLTAYSDSPPRGIAHVEEGNYLPMHGWDFFAKTQLLGVFSHFCASVSFRQLPWLTSLSDSPQRGILHVEEGVIY